MKKFQVLLLMLIALLSCSKNQEAKVNSASNNSIVATHPEENIACACTDTAKKTYHVWIQLDNVDSLTDIVKLKLISVDTTFILPKVKNGDQFVKIKYTACGVGELRLNVIRNGVVWGSAIWPVSCNPSNFCSESGGTNCPIP